MQNHSKFNHKIGQANQLACLLSIMSIGVTLLAVGSVYGGEFDAGTDRQMRIERRTTFDQRISPDGPRVALSVGGEWYITSRYNSDPSNEGFCEAAVYGSRDALLWEGELGCTVHLSSVAGFFFAYNPIGDHATAVYNLKLSRDPIAEPQCYPTEHAFAIGGGFLLLGGGSLILFNDLGEQLFSHKQRLDRDVALGISVNSNFIVVGDLLDGSPLVPERSSKETIDFRRERRQTQAKDSTESRIQYLDKNSSREKQSGRRNQRKSPDRLQYRRKPRNEPEHFVTVLTPTGERLNEIPISNYAHALAVSNEGGLVVWANGADIALLTVSGETKWTFRFPNSNNFVKALAVGDDGTVAAVVNESRERDHSERYIVSWHSDGRTLVSGQIANRPAMDIYDIELMIGDDVIHFVDSKEAVTFRSTKD